MVHQAHNNIKLTKVFYHQIVNYSLDWNFILFQLIVLNYQRKNKHYLFLEIFKEING